MISRRVIAVVAALSAATAVSACTPPRSPHQATSVAGRSTITGPVSWLLHASTDLGPARDAHVSTVVALSRRARPQRLLTWAREHGLQAQWSPGADWAAVTGPAVAMASAFGVPVRDYRSRSGQAFYAATNQASVPRAVAGEVTQVGRILSYRPRQLTALGRPRADVPANGLNPRQLLTAYNATSLASAGYTGKGSTVVFFEWSPPTQSDLDAFARQAGLPQFTVTMPGGSFSGPAGAVGETEMDVEVVHAIAPDARLVVVNADATVAGNDAGTVGQAIAKMYAATDSQFPGAVWSSSIGWECDRMWTAADLLPVEDALEHAEAHGTTSFTASGDTDGLECKGGQDFSAPPNQSDVGVDAVASLPAMTSVGGTTLSTDPAGNWVAEAAWDSPSSSIGTGGGVDQLAGRPAWQHAQGISNAGDSTHRLVPDVSADADPYTGVSLVMQGQPAEGGGTSQAAPIWAGLTVLMDDYLAQHGGHLIGAINPVLYRIAQGATRPAFHDVTLGGNAVYRAGPGYDPVTGLGTPVTANLVADILDVQKGTS